MKILIEGYSYSPKDVRNVLPEKRLLLTDEKVVIEDVGYFRNSKLMILSSFGCFGADVAGCNANQPSITERSRSCLC